MPIFLLDADAFICMRTLSLLDTVSRCDPAMDLRMTGFIARHELSNLSALIAELLARHRLKIEDVESKTEAGRRYRELNKAGVHKGEAEAIAWALGRTTAERPIFVSLDVAARQKASSLKLTAFDVMDFVVYLIDAAIISREDARVKLAVWLDPQQERGRPRDFTNFDETFERRKKNQP